MKYAGYAYPRGVGGGNEIIPYMEHVGYAYPRELKAVLGRSVVAEDTNILPFPYSIVVPFHHAIPVTLVTFLPIYAILVTLVTFFRGGPGPEYDEKC